MPSDWSRNQKLKRDFQKMKEKANKQGGDKGALIWCEGPPVNATITRKYINGKIKKTMLMLFTSLELQQLKIEKVYIDG